jgi:WD40 repeat protein
MQDVFISYARADAARVRPLVEALVATRGWSIWWDTALRPGEQFPAQIEQAVEEARCVLVVWSPRSVTSQWVVAEVSEGWERGVLVPVMIEECEPPLPFRQTQAADLTRWRGGAGAPELLAVVDSIERVLAKQPAPPRDELAEREARVRAHRRRRTMQLLAAGAAALLVVALAGWLWLTLGVRRSADRLAQQAVELREQVLALDEDEAEQVWWYVLMESAERRDRLELATLLAVEAFHEAKTKNTEAAVRALLLISPLSDEQVEIDHEVGALRFNADGRFVIASGGPDGTLVWDRQAGGLSATIAHGGMGGQDRWRDRRGSGSIHRGAFVLDASPTTDTIATAGPDHDAALWDLASGSEVARLAHEDTVTAVRFAPAGDVLATVTEGGIVRLWDVASRRELRRMEQGSAAYWVGVSPAGSYVASAAADHRVRVWRLANGDPVATIDSEGLVLAAAFSPDERRIVTFGDDLEQTTVWELPTGTRAWEIPMASNDAAGVVFAPEDRALVFAGVDGLLTWWNQDLHAEDRSRSVGGFVIGMAASGDRARIATNTADFARVWDARTGDELRQLPYAGWSTAVAISADGRWLASTGQDGDGTTFIDVTEIWPADPVAAACKKVQRNLTRDEWREYMGESAPWRETCPGLGEGQESN